MLREKALGVRVSSSSTDALDRLAASRPCRAILDEAEFEIEAVEPPLVADVLARFGLRRIRNRWQRDRMSS